MNKIESPISVLDFGSYSLGLAIYDKIILSQNLYYEEKINFKKKNQDSNLSLISNIIDKAEKTLGQHLKEILLLIDSSSTFTIDLSIQKNYEKKKLCKEDIDYLVTECENIIKANYENNYILHIIKTNIFIDNKSVNDLENFNQETNKVSVDLKFIMINKKSCEEISKILYKKHISIKKIFSTSYLKSLGLIKKFGISGYSSFIDIGYKKSSLSIYQNNILLFSSNTHIGGDHVTKDISKILKLSYRIAEAKKIKFSKKNEINHQDQNELLLNKIINARLEEIVELLFINCPIIENNFKDSKTKLFFTGNGSKVLNKNFLSFGPEFNFISEMSIIEELRRDVLDAAIDFHAEYQKIQPKKSTIKLENKGFFEKLFDYLSLGK